ncbi:MAG: S-adenosylmethionine:tRNA ribosyltransferase-isomerase [Bacteroidia bacterium]
MNTAKDFQLSDFRYDLPKDQIPQYPLRDRSKSKLLVYRDQKSIIDSFINLKSHLEGDELLVYNNAKVIPARLYFKRATGAQIEVLLIQPFNPANYDQSFSAKSTLSWECMIGNLKKWKDEEVISLKVGNEILEAKLLNRNSKIVQFNWYTDNSFHEVLAKAGELPIPPYLERETELSDYEQYQTVFAQKDGSVAAPTAGLHFTDELLTELKEEGIEQCELTLHVGAGTFLPIKTENVLEHDMHQEFFEIGIDSLKMLLQKSKRIAVGTTSLRVLESLYYFGLRLKNGQDLDSPIGKLEPYHTEDEINYEESLELIVNYLNEQRLNKLYGSTEIMILPHYKLKSITALLTNFHLPESTLLLLVSSVVGGDWQSIYQKALENNFRFLSYGDSSLLFCE